MADLQINNLSDFAKNAKILWTKGKDSASKAARNSGLFKEVDIPMESGNTREFTEIDLEEYADVKGESDQASHARVQQGYTKVGKLYRVAKDITISYEMRTQGKYMEIKRKLTNLGKQTSNRMDLDMTHRITYGNDTSYTDLNGRTIDTSIGDGKSLFDTGHTVKGGSDTFRNILANNPQLSTTSLESMEQMRNNNTINQFGEKMTMKADILFTTDDPNTVRTAREILRSSGSTEDSKNVGVENTFQGNYRHVILPRLATDASGKVDSNKEKYWGLASSDMSTAYLGVHEEPRIKSPGSIDSKDFSNDDWKFGARAGYMIVIVTGGWISLSKGDATT
jgi:hypothetical protein